MNISGHCEWARPIQPSSPYRDPSRRQSQRGQSVVNVKKSRRPLSLETSLPAGGSREDVVVRRKNSSLAASAHTRRHDGHLMAAVVRAGMPSDQGDREAVSLLVHRQVGGWCRWSRRLRA
jgi:hypothetical protein